MSNEYFKAENSEEIVWLRLNRLKTVTLCEKLIAAKLEKKPNSNFNSEILKAKSIGLSSAIESAIGYWELGEHDHRQALEQMYDRESVWQCWY